VWRGRNCIVFLSPSNIGRFQVFFFTKMTKLGFESYSKLVKNKSFLMTEAPAIFLPISDTDSILEHRVVTKFRNTKYCAKFRYHPYILCNCNNDIFNQIPVCYLVCYCVTLVHCNINILKGTVSRNGGWDKPMEQ
jgi:hypothetical protein